MSTSSAAIRRIQQIRTLDYLAAGGTLTRLDAWDKLGVVEVSSRIAELRSCGHGILTERIRITNSYGERVSIARWSYPMTQAGERQYLESKRERILSYLRLAEGTDDQHRAAEQRAELAVIDESLRSLKAIANTA